MRGATPRRITVAGISPARPVPGRPRPPPATSRSQPRLGSGHHHRYPQQDPRQHQPGDNLLLAIVQVDGDRHAGPFSVRQPFAQEPDWVVTCVNFDLDHLLTCAGIGMPRGEFSEVKGNGNPSTRKGGSLSARNLVSRVGCVFRRKLDTDSRTTWTPQPARGGARDDRGALGDFSRRCR